MKNGAKESTGQELAPVALEGLYATFHLQSYAAFYP